MLPRDFSKEDALIQYMSDVEDGVRTDDYDGKDSDDYADWDWERYYRIQNQTLFENERAIYAHLRPLQGSTIPRCYGAVHVLGVSRALGFLGEVPGLVLEHVDGSPMDALEVGVDIAHEAAQRAGQQAFEAVQRLSEHGVIHFDLRRANFLVTPARVVLIDFGVSRVRAEGETDDEWREAVRVADEVHGVRLMLHRSCFRDRTPPLPVEGFAGYLHFNAMMAGRKEWRDRYYRPVIEGGLLVTVRNENGWENVYHHAAWELKA